VVEDGRRILSNVVSTQAALHAAYGGVVPEVAARHHLENICAVIEKAMADAGMTYPELDAVAVTQGPRLVGALLVGVQVAKGIAFVHGNRSCPCITSPDIWRPRRWPWARTCPCPRWPWSSPAGTRASSR
jgi:N6-L-threonylcarbamoyladenine synthase